MNDDELRNREPDMSAVNSAQALVPTDFPQARIKFEELGNRGSAVAMLYLAFELAQRGNADDAKRWYQAAYEKGSSTALFSLATIKYHDGQRREAESLWAEGASNDDGPSMFCLASMYLDTSDKVKLAEAKRLLEKAHEYGQLRATYLLGKLLATGRYGIQNVPKGVVLFLRFIFSAFRVAYRDPTSRRLL